MLPVAQDPSYQLSCVFYCQPAGAVPVVTSLPGYCTVRRNTWQLVISTKEYLKTGKGRKPAFFKSHKGTVKNGKLFLDDLEAVPSETIEKINQLKSELIITKEKVKDDLHELKFGELDWEHKNLNIK